MQTKHALAYPAQNYILQMELGVSLVIRFQQKDIDMF